MDSCDERNCWEVAQGPQWLDALCFILSLAVGALLLIVHEVRLVLRRDALQLQGQLARQPRLQGQYSASYSQLAGPKQRQAKTDTCERVAPEGKAGKLLPSAQAY